MASKSTKASQTNGKAHKGNGKGKVAPKAQNAPERAWGLTADELKTLLATAKAEKRFPNPYRITSSYGSIVQALADLGTNKPHPFAKLKAKVATILGKESWAEFVNRKPRNKATAKDADERLHQNVQVIRRVKDYGRCLAQVGASIDVSADDKGNRSYTLKTK